MYKVEGIISNNSIGEGFWKYNRLEKFISMLEIWKEFLLAASVLRGHKVNKISANETPLSLLWEPGDSRKAIWLCEARSYLGQRLGAICTVVESSYEAIIVPKVDQVEWNLIMHIFSMIKIMLKSTLYAWEIDRERNSNSYLYDVVNSTNYASVLNEHNGAYGTWPHSTSLYFQGPHKLQTSCWAEFYCVSLFQSVPWMETSYFICYSTE